MEKFSNKLYDELKYVFKSFIFILLDNTGMDQIRLRNQIFSLQ